jgi:DNA-binding PadR family transcriptional regulator
MIEHEIILLGLLKESPKHGYEIKKKIKEIFSLFAGVELKSVYYPLRILEKKGMVIKRKNKPNRRPERFVYELTEKGQLRFQELLTKSFLNFKRPEFSLDLSLYFLNNIEPKIAKHKLCARLRVMEKFSVGLTQMVNTLKKGKPSCGVNILEHNLRMVETEAKFLSALIKTL